MVCVNATLKAQSQYAGRVDFGFGSDYNIILYTSHGKLINPNLYIGLGTGLNVPLFNYDKDGEKGDALAFPLSMDIQYIPLKSKISPIICTRIGGENTIMTSWSEPYGHPVSRKYKLVGFVSPAIGVRMQLVGKFSINLKFSAYFRTASTYNISKQACSYSLGFEF